MRREMRTGLVLMGTLILCQSTSLAAERKQPPTNKEHVARCGTDTGPRGRAVGDAYNLSQYVERLDQRAKSAWKPPKGMYQTVVLELEIERQGKMLNLQVEKSSGDESFNLSALAAVRSAQPFAPLPQPRQKEKTTAHLVFINSPRIEQKREQIAYLTAVQNSIFKQWVSQNNSEDRQVTTEFHVERNGKVTRWRIGASSESTPFNKAALDAVKTAAPFPPLPNSLSAYDVQFILSFAPRQTWGQVETTAQGSETEVFHLPELKQ